jgi:N-acetylmuramoyl-L-alanine amidase
VEKCNKNSVDVDVSIHFNSGAKDEKGNGKTTGTEVYVYSDSSKAKTYAEKIVTEISNLGFKNRGVKTSKNLYVLKNTKSPALLIECCFVDDADDAALYNYKDVASAIVKGLTGQVLNETSASSKDTSSKEGAVYRVQVGAFSNKSNAEKLKNELENKGYSAIVVEG